MVAVAHTGTPPRSALSIRLAGEPCRYSRSATRAWIVGITKGWPSTSKPTWQISASSRMASIVARSYRPRSGLRRTRTRGEAGWVSLGSRTISVTSASVAQAILQVAVHPLQDDLEALDPMARRARAGQLVAFRREPGQLHLALQPAE